MTGMKYILLPGQRAFKDAVRTRLEAEVRGSRPDNSPRTGLRGIPAPVIEGILRTAGKLDESGRPCLTRLEAVVAIEEIARGASGSGPEIISSPLFGALSPGLMRAAADIGFAQGALAPWLEEFSASPNSGRSGSEAWVQPMADLISEIEGTRLILYREAVLEDGRGGGAVVAASAAAMTAAERAAGDIRSRTERLVQDIEKRSER
jgi:hypothetical protein